MYKVSLKLLQFIVITMSLSACGGGGSGSNNNPDVQELTLSQSSIIWRPFQTKTGQYNSRTFIIHLKFNGDGVLIGYPPGATQSSWIGFSEDTILAPEKEVDVPITLTPPINASGNYSATIRFLSGDADGSRVTYKDLSISVNIIPLPNISEKSLTFASINTEMTVPASKILSIDTGDLEGITWSAHFDNKNTGVDELIILNPSGTELSVGVSSVQKAGRYLGNVVFHFQLNDETGDLSVPVEYMVSPGKPSPRFIAPPLGYVNEAGSFVIRGDGFTTTSIQGISVGGMPITSFSILNDTQINVQYEAFNTVGNKSVTLVTDIGTYNVGMDFLIKDRPLAVAGDITVPTHVVDLKFDSMRDVIIVSTQSTLFRFKLTNGEWKIENQRELTWGKINLTPDGKCLIKAENKTITLINAVTLEDYESYTIPFNSGFPRDDPWAYLSPMTNSGITLAITTSPTFLLFNYVNRTFEDTNAYWNSDLTFISPDGADILILPNSLIGQLPFTGYYHSSTNSFESFPSTQNYSDGGIVSSVNGQRLLLGRNIADRDFNILGHMADNDETEFLNYRVGIFVDGLTAFKDTGGTIYKYDLTAAPPYPNIGSITYAPYGFGSATSLTPDGSMMIIGGGDENYNGKIVVIVL